MGRLKFSANLGFLWSDLPLPEAIRAAKAAGFDAVECHWPYGYATQDVKTALLETGLPMLGLNTNRGDADGMGLSALSDRVPEARAAVDQAIAYAAEIGAANVHVMAGFAEGDAARECFVQNLSYACAEALRHNITVLIEPINRYDAPGYFLQTTDQAISVMDEVGVANLKLMFDCYHVQRMEGAVTKRLERLLPRIGHIQFASVPDRGPPDQGELNYDYIFSHIADLGYKAPLGAEYKPIGHTDDTLRWLVRAR